jgi:glycosyltransferase involved in cell wall biosynthesis
MSRESAEHTGTPRVSVVVPNYNHARYLRQRLDSIRNQTYQDFELIVLDDASTDESAAIIHQYIDPPRIRFLPNTVNSGNPFAQWNKGVAHARGEFVWVAESDDYADTRFLERLVDMLETHPECGMACCESWYVYGDQTPHTRTNQSHLPEQQRWRQDFVAHGPTECATQLIRCNTMPNASAIVFRRELFNRIGGADQSMRLCGDWLCWAKMLCIADLAHVGEPLNYYRCQTAAVRTKNHATATTTAEVYRILAYIHAHTNVPASILDEVLVARAQRFIDSAARQGFTAGDAWKVYLAARSVDRRAFRRILLRWSKLQAGTIKRRARAAVP